jgi:ElaB/YqjD/DUF883 family membrane-anchored ribosome-binding protein
MAAEYTATDVSTGGRSTRTGTEESALKQTARDYLARGKEKAIELEEGFEGMIQEHPVRSILIAAGVGALIGMLVCRR